MKLQFDVNSVEETWGLAEKFARGLSPFVETLRPGDVICLEGDLGAGKTTFTQGLARALGVSGRVTSPTFCLVQEHRVRGTDPQRTGTVPVEEGTVPHVLPHVLPQLLVHMDLYRLSSEEDVLAIGWEDYLAEGAVLVVEWPERAGSLVPADAKHVVFTHLDGEERRRLVFSC